MNIEQITAYIPYDLPIAICGMNDDYKYDWSVLQKHDTLTMSNYILLLALPHLYKPILKPLSEITGDEHPNLKFYTTAMIENSLKFDEMPVGIFRELLKNHYNVFNIPEEEYIKKG